MSVTTEPIKNTNHTLSPLLQVESISKDFGYRKVLNRVNLNLFRGDLTLLLGKNGAGKSTLLKIISGLIRPSEGKITYLGGDISKTPDKHRKAIGVISHDLQFYNELTARENLVFYAKLGKISFSPTRINAVLDQTGLLPFADIAVKTFSSGMGKRLNIARLKILRPEILLLDEPYTGLDYDSTDFFGKYLRQFKDEGGTILMISHQIETCYDLCDRIAILEQGTIQSHLEAEKYTCDDLVETYQKMTR